MTGASRSGTLAGRQPCICFSFRNNFASEGTNILARLVIHFGLDSMVPETKDRLVAPKISELLTPNPPDISRGRKFPINTFIANTHLSLALSNRIRQACFNFLRNAEGAFDEYCDARTALRSYLKTEGRTVVPYFSALRHFEHCLGHLYHAVLSVNVLAKKKQFEAGDGTVLDRVSTLHNHVKHMDGKYSRVSIRDEISFKLFATSHRSKKKSYAIEDMASVPIWLTNTGLECRQASLTYTELAVEVMSTLNEAVNTAVLQPPNVKISSS